jgi:hypothetical protein
MAWMIALLSVVGLVAPVVKDTFRSDEDLIIAQILSIDRDIGCVDILATNLGARPGAIVSCWVIPPAGTTMATGRTPWSLQRESPSVIQPEHTVELRFRSSQPLPELATAHDLATKYRLEVVIVHYDGRRETRDLDFRGVAGL